MLQILQLGIVVGRLSISPVVLIATGLPFGLLAQGVIRPLQSQATSSVSVSTGSAGAQTIEIRNVSYQVAGGQIPGRPSDERLLLRKTTHSKQIIGDEGSEATISLEAWPLGADPRQRPLYTLKVTGGDGQTLDDALFVASRGLEEVEWWSIYQLGNARHMFDTHLPLLSFSISRDTVETRYVGLMVATDDASDPRLKMANAVGVLTYASKDRVIRELLLTCDDPKQAPLLKSLADGTRKLSLVEAASAELSLRLEFSQNFPSPKNAVDLVIPVRGDDLDAAHGQFPARLQASIWKR